MNLPLHPQPVEFKLVRTMELQTFEKTINQLLKEGWVFHGEMTATNTSFQQAMVRIELRPLPIAEMPKVMGVPAGVQLIQG
jgi:hypothetical protein